MKTNTFNQCLSVAQRLMTVAISKGLYISMNVHTDRELPFVNLFVMKDDNNSLSIYLRPVKLFSWAGEDNQSQIDSLHAFIEASN